MRSLFTRAVVFAISCALPAFVSSAALDASSSELAAAKEFRDAMLRVRLHEPDLADSTVLAGYPIYPYLVAARLRRDLNTVRDTSLDENVDHFLLAHSSQPVSRGLRHDWLTSLAQRGRWDWFLPRSADVLDAALLCSRLAGEVATGNTDGLAGEALARWSLPQKQPAQCAPVFDWLQERGLITSALAEARAHAALLADNPRLARESAAQMPAQRVLGVLRWCDLLEAPKSAVTVLAMHPSLPVEADALAAGYDKLARSDVDTALVLLPQLLERDDASPALAARLRRSAALAAAYDRDVRALHGFEALPPEAVDGAVAEWRVRAALWSGDFARARRWLDQMPPTLAAQPRWRYWQARAVAATAGAEAGAPLFMKLAMLRDYYGYLAADQLHLPYQLNAHATADDPAIQSALGDDPGLVRAHELIDADLNDDAAIEWNSALATANAATKIQAARLAASWGWYSQSIATLAQSGEFDDVVLRYPRPFLESVERGSEIAQIPGDWIYAVMRQESLFRKDAISRADARGLMQMLPATAASVARRWHLPAPGHEGLLDPAIAVPLGAAYMRELMDRYENRLPLMLAAYNAGPGAVARWLPAAPIAGDVWVENIPYNETRAYVQHIVEHIVAFATVRGKDPPRLSDIIKPIEPAVQM